MAAESKKGLTKADKELIANLRLEREGRRRVPAGKKDLSVGERATLARVHQGLSTRALAKKMKISQPYVSLMESGRANPQRLVEYWGL